MRRITAIVSLLALVAVASSVAAAPAVNSAIIKTRIFNDGPGTTLSTVNSYPASISITDVNGPGYLGFANLHVWRFSTDGATEAVFVNGDAFRFCADLTLSGEGQGESGLQIAPWWDLNADGFFNVRTTDGEIACFGGRMRFYSFTVPEHGGLHYVKGTPIHLECIYLPNGLSSASPATIEYKLTYASTNYSSGPLPYDQGNPLEDPPHGLWGILSPTNVGGHLKFFLSQSPQGTGLTAEWSNICYDPLTVAVQPAAWGAVKNLFR